MTLGNSGSFPRPPPTLAMAPAPMKATLSWCLAAKCFTHTPPAAPVRRSVMYLPHNGHPTQTSPVKDHP
jgi:hypothetical protein